MKIVSTLTILVTCSIVTSCYTGVVVKPKPRLRPVEGVKVLPKQHKVVHVRGKKYYYWGGRHHVWKPGKGYVIVKP